MRLLALGLGAAAVLATAPAASATQYCFGSARNPVALVCYTTGTQQSAGVGEDSGYAVRVPAVCTGVGCTPHQVPLPYVYYGPTTAGSVQHDGRTYDLSLFACTSDSVLVRCQG
jgi:hypothetical protein